MEPIGIIPAAGHGMRFLPFRIAKELLPVGFTNNGEEEPRLRIVCQYALECLAVASVQKAFVIISDHKFEIIKFLSDGSDFCLSLSYLHQRTISGLPAAIDCAYPWVSDSISVLVMPDTIVSPPDACRVLVQELSISEVDLVLGVFPTPVPERLCPVEYNEDGRVLALHDKVHGIRLNNTWGIAAWKPKFSAFLHEFLKQPDRQHEAETTLAEVITAFIREGMRVKATPFPSGIYKDVGTVASLLEVMGRTAERETGRPH